MCMLGGRENNFTVGKVLWSNKLFALEQYLICQVVVCAFLMREGCELKIMLNKRVFY